VLELILMLIATILLVLAAFGVAFRVALGWLGLAIWAFTVGVLPHL
jgi:hypothetical protein